MYIRYSLFLNRWHLVDASLSTRCLQSRTELSLLNSPVRSSVVAPQTTSRPRPRRESLRSREATLGLATHPTLLAIHWLESRIYPLRSISYPALRSLEQAYRFASACLTSLRAGPSISPTLLCDVQDAAACPSPPDSGHRVPALRAHSAVVQLRRSRPPLFMLAVPY